MIYSLTELLGVVTLDSKIFKVWIMAKFSLISSILVILVIVQVNARKEIKQDSGKIYFPDQQADVLETNNFEWNLFKEVLKQECDDCNAILSPYSVKLILSLLSESIYPNSESKQQLFKALFPKFWNSDLYNYWAKSLNSLNTRNENYNVSLSSIILTKKGIGLSNRFVKTARDVYNAVAFPAHTNDPKELAKALNNGISRLTKGYIKDILDEETTRDLSVLLLNVLYFQGHWEKPFPNDNTIDLPFHVNDKKVVKTPMMYVQAEYDYYNSSTLNSDLIRLKYKGNKFAMNLILPHARDGLKNVLDKLDATKIRADFSKLSKRSFGLRFPKFEFDYSAKLKEPLKTLGIKNIFTNKANFLEIYPNEGLTVNNVKQKVKIQVTEDGTTAAAVTSVDLGFRMAGPPLLPVDHPFLFFIEDLTTGAVLFSGKVSNPKA